MGRKAQAAVATLAKVGKRSIDEEGCQPSGELALDGRGRIIVKYFNIGSCGMWQSSGRSGFSVGIGWTAVATER
jgi:hypothetical protein